MSETANMKDTGALMMGRAAHAGANVEYYRAYYHALVEKRAARLEHSRRLEAIKMERRKARRERWLQTIKSLANVLSGAEALN